MKPTKISIRPRYVRCPHCLERYVKLPDNSIVCPGCDNKNPSSFFLDFYRSGRQQIFCDERGAVLDTKMRAELLSEQILYEIQRGIFQPEKYKKAELKKYWVDQLLEQFLEMKLEKIAPSYKHHYKLKVKVAKDFFLNMDVRDIKRVDLVRYKSHLEKMTFKRGKEVLRVKQTTVGEYLSHFKVFLNWCRTDLGILTITPTFPKVEYEEPQINWISAKDQAILLGHARPTDVPLIKFLMLSGVRPGEARALKVGDVDLQKDLIKIHATFSGTVYRPRRKGRGARSYMIPIHDEIRSYIVSRVKSALPGVWLFPSPKDESRPYTAQRLDKVWYRMKKGAGITYKLRLYDATRHSVASNLLSRGESIYTVKEVLGHTDISTTLRYSHVDLSSMRRTISKITLLDPPKIQSEVESK